MINTFSRFAGKAARPSKLPGYEPNSWAYYGDDGSAMSPERNNTQFSQSFGSMSFDFSLSQSFILSLAGDIVGCGVDFTTYKAFFTRNGTLIGIGQIPGYFHSLLHLLCVGQVFENVGRNEVYPSVGLQHTGDSIRTNFGQDPFEFDIEYHVRQQQNDVWNRILTSPIGRRTLQRCSESAEGSIISVTEHTNDQSPLTEEESNQALNDLIMSYLVHHGHIKTARAFKKQCDNSDVQEGHDSVILDGSDAIGLSYRSRRIGFTEADVELRTNIVNLVHAGNIDGAIDLLRHHHPNVLEADKQFVFFKLRLRKFVELILRTTELKKKMKELKELEEQRWKSIPPQDSWMTDEMGMDIDEDAPPTMVEPTNSTSSHDKYANPELNKINVQYEDALKTALSYGQALSHDYHSDPRPELEPLFHKTLGIVAYEDPSEECSGVADIVGQQARITLAHEINEAILSEIFLSQPFRTFLNSYCCRIARPANQTAS